MPNNPKEPNFSEPSTSDQAASPSTEANSEVLSQDQAAAPDAIVRNAKKNTSKPFRISISFIILVLIIAAAFALYKHHNSSNQKKDIPYLTYGFSGSGDIPEIYPTESGDDNNSIFEDSQLFEGLVGYKNEITITPLLATSWYNPNDTTWIFNLRHGVTFHSGRTMTATDVAFSLDYDLAHDSNYNGGTALYYASDIKQVKIINPYRVEIITNQPDAVLLNQLDYLYIVDSKDKVGDPDAGTGPYTVQGDYINPNANSVNLIAFKNYWGGHVYTREVHLQEDATNTQMAEDVADGHLDIAGSFNHQQIATIQAKIKSLQEIHIPDLGLNYLELNTERTSSPLYNLSARQAVSYALNIPQILKVAGLDGVQASQMIPPSLPGHDTSISDIPYNPSKAKQLLKNVPNLGSAITLVYPSGEDDSIGNEIAKELSAVGFNVKTMPIANLNTLGDMEYNGQGDMFYLGYETSTLDGLDIINNTIVGTQNFTSTALNDLINQTNVAFNPTTRISDLQNIEKLVASQIPVVPLYTQNRIYVQTKPYVVNNSLDDLLTDVYLWQVYQR